MEAETNPWDFERVHIDYRSGQLGWRWWLVWLAGTVVMWPIGAWLVSQAGHGMGKTFDLALGGIVGLAFGALFVFIGFGAREIKRRSAPVNYALSTQDTSSPELVCERYARAIGAHAPRMMRWSHISEIEGRIGHRLPRLWIVQKPDQETVDDWMEALADPEDAIDIKVEHPTAVGTREDATMYGCIAVCGVPIAAIGIMQGWAEWIISIAAITGSLIAWLIYYFFHWKHLEHAGIWLVGQEDRLALIERDTNLVDLDRREIPAQDLLFLIAPDPTEKSKIKHTARLWIVGEGLEKPVYIDL